MKPSPATLTVNRNRMMIRPLQSRINKRAANWWPRY